MAASAANSTAFRFRTGKAPGSPKQTGQTFVFGGSPKRVEHEQKILVTVSSWTWTSNPMTGSYFERAETVLSIDVAISQDYRRLKDSQELGIERTTYDENRYLISITSFSFDLHISSIFLISSSVSF